MQLFKSHSLIIGTSISWLYSILWYGYIFVLNNANYQTSVVKTKSNTMNKLSVFSAIVIILGVECFHGINADEFSIETRNVIYYSINLITLLLILKYERQVLISYSKIKRKIVLIQKITNTFKFVKKKYFQIIIFLF